MDVIDKISNRVLLSKHVPGTEYESDPWIDLRSVDFSGIGIADVSTPAGKLALMETPRRAYVIENCVARWRTEEELYDLDAAKEAKLSHLKVRVLETIRDRGANQVGQDWVDVLNNISGDQVAVFGLILGLCYIQDKNIVINDIATQYVTLKGQIEAATTKEELDAIVIP